jgi:ABC-type branched-subunit amino acid transport system ATPase component
MLAVDNVVKTFEGFTALRGVSLRAMPGKITGIIGPNGSGKSTLFGVITGVYKMDSGNITLFGEPLLTSRPDLVARRGVFRTFQIPRIAERMTVLENLLASPNYQDGERFAFLFRPRSGLADEEAVLRARAWKILQLVELHKLANEWAGSLSGGQQKLLSLGMALIADSRVLLLDEPAAGVNPVLISRSLRTLERIRDQGKIIVIIEHNIQVISDICDDVYVLDAGEVIAHDAPAAVRADSRVRQAYLGIKG